MSTIKAVTLQHTDGSSPTTLTGQSAAKVWVKGTSSAGLSDSFNISSGTDQGTGEYSYDLTSAFASVAYANTVTVESNSERVATRDLAYDDASTLGVGCWNAASASDQAHSSTAHGDLA